MVNESFAVIGGEGFLGHNLILTLADRHPTSSVLSIDLTQRFSPTPSSSTTSVAAWAFEQADLTSFDQISAALSKYRVTTVFHVASPWLAAPRDVCEKVNVVGTQTVVDASIKVGVKKLVYTSSASVIYSGESLTGVDERLPHAWPPMDPYTETKAKAENIAIAANGQGGILTCAIRPSGIYGPGDRQFAPGAAQVLKNGQTKWQIGNNENLADWTYVDNVVHAHILAAERLGTSVPVTAFNVATPILSASLPRRPLPTSIYRPFPDAEETTEIGDWSEKAEAVGVAVGKDGVDPPLPARRTRYNQFGPMLATSTAEKDRVPVAGQIFFITNGEPMPFWDLLRGWWFAIGGHVAPYVIALPPGPGIVLAWFAESFSKLMGREAGLTVPKVRLSCANRFYDVEKARVLLGYEPVVSTEEGLKRMAEWWLTEGYKTQAKK